MCLLSVLGSLEEKTYKIQNRAFNESPLETEVIKVSIDDKTYCLPKKDLALDIEKYPLESEVTHVVEIPKEPNCFGKLKSKILCCACPPCCCSCCPEKNKPTIKTYIVRNDDLTELNDVESPEDANCFEKLKSTLICCACPPCCTCCHEKKEPSINTSIVEIPEEPNCFEKRKSNFLCCGCRPSCTCCPEKKETAIES